MTYINQILQQHPDAGYWHQQYPWFSVGRLVNTANKKNTPAFEESAQKTALFFNDIPRLHWLLHQEDVDITGIKAFVNQKTETSEQLPVIKSTESVIHAEAVITEPDSILNEKENTNGIHTDIPENPAAEAVKKEDASSHQATIPEPGNLKTAVAGIPDKINEDHQQAEVFNATDPKFIAEEITEEPEETDTENPELVPLPTGMLSESLAKAAYTFKNTPVDEDALVFKTAYQHTVDYFASQGIKLDGEPAKDDRFGQQLKTFTSWLRQMKRLPDSVVPEADPLVDSHAAHSLQKDEVLTEPMADILLKQGKNSQAIYVLEKLRLLHPQKSHYFAARIQQIKHP